MEARKYELELEFIVPRPLLFLILIMKNKLLKQNLRLYEHTLEGRALESNKLNALYLNFVNYE